MSAAPEGIGAFRAPQSTPASRALARAALRSLVLAFGDRLFSDRPRALVELREASHDSPREVAVLACALSAEIPDRLHLAGSVDEGVAARLTTRLLEVVEMPHDAARWAVMAWAYALDVHATAKDVDEPWDDGPRSGPPDSDPHLDVPNLEVGPRLPSASPPAEAPPAPPAGADPPPPAPKTSAPASGASADVPGAPIGAAPFDAYDDEEETATLALDVPEPSLPPPAPPVAQVPEPTTSARGRSAETRGPEALLRDVVRYAKNTRFVGVTTVTTVIAGGLGGGLDAGFSLGTSSLWTTGAVALAWAVHGGATLRSWLGAGAFAIAGALAGFIAYAIASMLPGGGVVAETAMGALVGGLVSGGIAYGFREGVLARKARAR